MRSGLNQFDKDVGEAFRVSERDERSVRSGRRLRREHVRSPLPQRLEGAGDVIDFEGDMMQPAAPLFDKERIGESGVRGFQEFMRESPDPEERRP